MGRRIENDPRSRPHVFFREVFLPGSGNPPGSCHRTHHDQRLRRVYRPFLTALARRNRARYFASANIDLVTPGPRSYLLRVRGRNLSVRQMALRCPDASNPRRAMLADHDWLINQRGVATVEPFDGTQVHGVVWQLSDHDLATLDQR